MEITMEELSKKFGDFCLNKKIKVVTAESCTAGLIGATIAMTPGSSSWLDCGFIVYTPEAKQRMLGVSQEIIEKYDITSVEVAKEMAWGAIEKSNANVALAVTGLAGPTGGTEAIPVGTVCMAWLFGFGDVELILEKKVFNGSRNEIREQVVKHMLEKVVNYGV
jgi:PncC family amidohydrolase